jgi:hypothetical protein
MTTVLRFEDDRDADDHRHRDRPTPTRPEPLLANLYTRRFVPGWKMLGLEQSLDRRADRGRTALTRPRQGRMAAKFGVTVPGYRHALPQLSNDLFLTDAGLETDPVFNHGINIREFAAHTLLLSESGRAAMVRYFEGFLALACNFDAGFILHSQTSKAHRHWAGALGQRRRS